MKRKNDLIDYNFADQLHRMFLVVDNLQGSVIYFQDSRKSRRKENSSGKEQDDDL